MKKIAFILLAAFLFVSCSKDSGSNIILDGRYVGYTEYNTFCLVIENGECTDFIIYNGSELFNYYKPASISTKGSYPKYTYRINDFEVQASFTDLENFTANLSGALCTHKDRDFGTVGEIFSVLGLKATGVHFKLDDRMLDVNGDGILDKMQPELFGK